MLRFIVQDVIERVVIRPCVIMMNVTIVSVFLLSIILLSVVAPQFCHLSIETLKRNPTHSCFFSFLSFN